MGRFIKKIKLSSFIFFLAVVYLAVSLISAQVELMTKKQEYESVVNQKERLEMEVRETQAMLDEEDDSVYIERIARERLGYANPGEKIYVDAQSQ